MGLYNKQPVIPPTVVWVVNPVGRVIDMTEDQPAVDLAKRGNEGWKLATDEQIAEAVAEREKRQAYLDERQAKRKAATEVAKDMAAAASSLVDGEAKASPRRRGKKKKGDAE